jgi:hypothetical protein
MQFYFQNILGRNRFESIDENGSYDANITRVTEVTDKQLNILFLFSALDKIKCFIENIAVFNIFRVELKARLPVGHYYLWIFFVFEFDALESKIVVVCHTEVNYIRISI